MLLPSEIKLVQQLDMSTCAHACLAMVTGESIEDIIIELGNGGDKEKEQDGLTERALLRFLVNHMILPEARQTIGNPFYDYGVYKVAAPSLNRAGRLHSLIVTQRPKNGLSIYDPNDGREGVKWWPQNTMMDKNADMPFSYTEVWRLHDMRF